MSRSQPSGSRPGDVVAVARPPGRKPGHDIPAPPRGTSIRRLGRWARRYRHALQDVAGDRTPPSASAAAPSGRVMLTHDDLLWFKTCSDEEGRLTLGLLECSPETIGVLLDDSGESLGLLLSRHEAQDLNRTLVAWLAGTTESASP